MKGEKSARNPLEILQLQLAGCRKRLDVVDIAVDKITNGDLTLIEGGIKNQELFYKERDSQIHLQQSCWKWQNAIQKLSTNPYYNSTLLLQYKEELRSFESKLESVNTSLKELEAKWIPSSVDGRTLSSFWFKRAFLLGIIKEVQSEIKYYTYKNSMKEGEVFENNTSKVVKTGLSIKTVRQQLKSKIKRLEAIKFEINRVTNGDSNVIETEMAKQRMYKDYKIQHQKLSLVRSSLAFDSINKRMYDNGKAQADSDQFRSNRLRYEAEIKEIDVKLKSLHIIASYFENPNIRLNNLVRERMILQSEISKCEIELNSKIKSAHKNSRKLAAIDSSNDDVNCTNRKRLPSDSTSYEYQLNEEIANIKQWLCMGLPVVHHDYNKIVKVRNDLLNYVISLRNWKKREADASIELNQFLNLNTKYVKKLKSNIQEYSKHARNIETSIIHLKYKPGGETIDMNNVEKGVPLRSVAQVEHELNTYLNQNEAKKRKLNESINQCNNNSENSNIIMSNPDVQIKQEVVDDNIAIKFEDISEDGDDDLSQDILNSSDWNEASMEYDFHIKEEYLRENVAADISNSIENNDGDSDDNINDNYNFDDFNNDYNDYASEILLDDDSDED